MSSLLRLILVAGLVAIAVLAVAIGLARNTAAMAAPAHLILFLVAAALYLAPSGVALHRNCAATGWIVTINVALGWTLFGWVIALGWAAVGKVAAPPRAPRVTRVAGH
jgi:hypothetical protein